MIYELDATGIEKSSTYEISNLVVIIEKRAVAYICRRREEIVNH
jgi:hypothetical protein